MYTDAECVHAGIQGHVYLQIDGWGGEEVCLEFTYIKKHQGETSFRVDTLYKPTQAETCRHFSLPIMHPAYYTDTRRSREQVRTDR